jgi:hypothetical protein
MITITRRELVNELSRDGGSIDVGGLGAAVRSALSAAGLDAAALADVAGVDGRIRGRAELSALFSLLDGIDADGARDSFVATTTDRGGRDVPTAAGALYEALRGEAEQQRATSRARGVVHLGMRPESAREATALSAASPPRSGGARSIQAADGAVPFAGAAFDVTGAAGRAALRDALVAGGVPAARADRLLAVVARQPAAVRDELARLGIALHHIGAGELPASRLVLSGHSGGDGIGDEDGNKLSFAAIAAVAAVFPEAASAIRHVAIAGCFSGFAAQLEEMRAMFPRLESFLGYTRFAPSAERGGPRDLVRWEGLTDGASAAAVDPWRAGIATWNRIDGYQDPAMRPLAEMQRSADGLAWAYRAYTSGRADPARAPDDLALDQYYAAIVALRHHPDLPPERIAQLDATRDAVFRLRHPELVRP